MVWLWGEWRDSGVNGVVWKSDKWCVVRWNEW